MTELETAIRDWAKARGLVSNSTPEAQFAKLLEEVQELYAALHAAKRLHIEGTDHTGVGVFTTYTDTADIEDAIGDIAVVLCVISAQLGTSLYSCMWKAYDEIQHRKGKMVNGVFVKEE